MTTLSHLSTHVQEFRRAHVVCVGDVMLDRYLYGRVDRISPEAPVPVLRITHEREMLGGAGNVASNLASLGAGVSVFGVVGDDAPGKQVRELLSGLGVHDGWIAAAADKSTTIKMRCIGGGQQMLRVDHETPGPIAEEIGRELIHRLENTLHDHSVLVLSDYGKGVLTRDVIRSSMAAAKRRGRPVIVDPKGRDYTIYQGADVITPNRNELADATGMPVRDDDEVTAAARQLIEQCGFSIVVAKRSEQGMTIVHRDGQVHHLRAEAREVFDVSGAGDTVTATLAAGLSIGLSIRDAAATANLAAGVAVGKLGTAPTTQQELLQAISATARVASDHKLWSLDQASARVQHWKQSGLRIGFTNGCYDLLHPGHVRLLEEARGTCDRLIVGLNTDESVRRLKGPQRPIQTERARATVLASLTSVDAVVLFGDDTPLNLIRTLKPDVLIKGADYTVETVVGASDVIAAGGQVVLIDLIPEQSTSRLVRRISDPEQRSAA